MIARALRLLAIAALSLVPGAAGRGQEAGRGKEAVAEPATPAGVAEARDLFRRGKYEEAAKRFHQFENELKFPVELSQECFFSEAECYRLRKEYPHAADVYAEMLKRFPDTLYREQVLQHVYEIATYWLEDTRAEMKQAREAADGRRPQVVVHLPQWDRSKPTVGQERRALGLLVLVRSADLHGPLADRCLFTQGGVKFYRHEYAAAGHCFEDLADFYPHSALAYPALKYAVLSKVQAHGALGRGEEVRKLVERAQREYPAQAAGDAEFFAQKVKLVEDQEKKK
jgi:tetratricopeptide (TPR) repeat protein